MLCARSFADVHAYAEEVLGRPVWTHELGDKAVVAELREACKPEFLRLWGLS